MSRGQYGRAQGRAHDWSADRCVRCWTARDWHGATLPCPMPPVSASRRAEYVARTVETPAERERRRIRENRRSAERIAIRRARSA